MSGYYDIYALAPVRTSESVEQFLVRFAPARTQSAVEYEVPEYSDTPTAVFQTPSELVAYCVAHPAVEHRVYWRCISDSDPAHAMAFFTADGGLILGLSVVADEERWLAELLAAVGSGVGLVRFEQPPPDTANEFVAAAARPTESTESSSAKSGT